MLRLPTGVQLGPVTRRPAQAPTSGGRSSAAVCLAGWSGLLPRRVSQTPRLPESIDSMSVGKME